MKQHPLKLVPSWNAHDLDTLLRCEEIVTTLLALVQAPSPPPRLRVLSRSSPDAEPSAPHGLRGEPLPGAGDEVPPGSGRPLHQVTDR